MQFQLQAKKGNYFNSEKLGLFCIHTIQSKIIFTSKDKKIELI